MLTEQERIQAIWSAFSQAWLDVWASFSCNAPNDKSRQTLVVWSKVQHIPAAAWPFIANRVGELDRKPQNMAKAFKDAYCEWIERKESHSAKKEIGRRAEGPIGLRLIQLRKNNPNLSPFERLRIATQEGRK